MILKLNTLERNSSVIFYFLYLKKKLTNLISKIEEDNIVDNKKLANFWSWFGCVLSTIRFKRHIRKLWNDG